MMTSRTRFCLMSAIAGALVFMTHGAAAQATRSTVHRVQEGSARDRTPVRPALATVAARQAPSPGDPEGREQFLRLLFQRQDTRLFNNLYLRQELLVRAINVVSQLPLNPPAQVRLLASIGVRLANVNQQIINPPPTPARIRVSREISLLQRTAAQIQDRLNTLMGMTPRTPAQALLLERLIQQTNRRLGAVNANLAMLGRLPATPFRPGPPPFVPGPPLNPPGPPSFPPGPPFNPPGRPF